MLKLAPTLIVDRVEPSLQFFVERLGFQKVADVPAPSGDGTLQFAMLVSGAVEIHLQSRKSVELPCLQGGVMPSSSFLYLDVDDVQALYQRLKDCDIVAPLEKKFYGATDFFLREPGGHVLGFSQDA